MKSLCVWHDKTLCVMAPGLQEQICVLGLSGTTAKHFATCHQLTGRIGKTFLFNKGNEPVIVMAKKLRYEAGELFGDTIFAARPYRETYTLSLGISSVMPRLTEYLESSGERQPIFIPEGGENFPLYLGECLIPASEKNYFFLLTETDIRNYGRYDENLVTDRRQVGRLVFRWTLQLYEELSSIPLRVTT